MRTNATTLCLILVLLVASTSCSLEDSSARPRTAAATSAPGMEQVELRARAVDEDGTPLPLRALSLELFQTCRAHGNTWVPDTTRRETQTDDAGWFTVRVARRVAGDCKRSVLVRPRDALELGGDHHPQIRIELPVVIEGPVLEVGVVELVAPPRRYRQLSDDELERVVLGTRAYEASDHARKLEKVVSEMIRRGGARFEAFLEKQLRSLREEESSSAPSATDFFFLTALRRLQQRPDPLAVRVIDGAAKPSQFPLGPVFHVQLANVDVEGTKLLFVEHEGDWNENWHVEVRTHTGERVPLRAWPRLGGSDPRERKTLAPGEVHEERVEIMQYAVIPAAGVYEGRVLYLGHDKIGQEEDLTDRIVASSPWTRFEILRGTIRSTPAEQERARAVIAAVDESTPVRVWMIPNDPKRPYAGEPTRSDEVLWTLGWKAVKPLVDALDEKQLGVQKRSWIFAQLYNVTSLHVPYYPSGILGRSEFVDVRYSEDSGGFVIEAEMPVFSRGVDEQKHLAFAAGWKKTAASFVFETVPDEQPK